MKDWEDYKEHAKSANSRSRRDIKLIEKMSAIVSEILKSAKQTTDFPKKK